MKVLKIKDIVRTISITHKFDKDKLIAINTSDVENGIMHDGTLTAIEDLKGQFKKTVQKGDILFSEIRPANRKFGLVTKDDCADYVVSTKLMVLRKYNNEVDLRYFYYCLTNQPFLDMLQRKAENRIGSFPQITFDLLSEYAFPVPSLSEQEKIANIIFSLDHKIELNKQINDNLEAMAKQLYDYWFVQFDFPNEEGKPYKSSGGAMVWNERLKREIPIGWTCCSIKEMCDINKKTINKDEHKQIEYLDTGSITQGHISNTEIYSVDMAPSRAQRKVEDLSILYSSVRPRLLHYGILSTPNENFIVSTGFVTLDAKCKKMALMVYYFLTSNTITEHLASIADTAVSSYPSISTDDIAYLDIVIPSNDIIQKYNDIVEPMFRKMSTLRKEIDSLTKQRDELLPLLMNGQASVNYHLSASTCISFDISVLFLNFTNGNSLYETISLDYQCFALPLHSKENTHGNIQDDKRHIQQRQRQGDKHARERFLAFFYKCTSTVYQAAFGNAWCYRGYKGKVISESK